MRRMERGASYIPLIIVIVLLIVAGIWAYMSTDEADQLKKQLIDAQAVAEKAKKEKGDLVEYINGQVAKKTGFNYNQGAPEYDQRRIDVTKMDDAVAKMYRDMESWKIEFPRAVFKKPGTDQDFIFNDKFLEADPNDPGKRPFKFDLENGGMLREGDERWVVTYGPSAPIRDRQDLEKLIDHEADAFKRIQVDIAALVKQMEADRAGFVEKMDQAAKAQDALKKANDQKQRDLDELQTSTQNQIQGLRQQIAGLRDEVTKVTAEKDKAEKAAMKVEADLKTELATKDQEVVKLKRRKFEVEYPIGPDGEVLAAASGKGLVVINRGKKDHMIPGLVFNVYTFGKNARRIDLGVIKVLDVDTLTATAKVESLLSPMRPIVQGAKFESITYNPGEVMHFRLIGRFRKYGRSDAEKRLSELGAEVDSAVTIDTDFLVLGAPEQEEENLRDSEDYKRAVELGIKVITEEHLAQFLMY